MGTPWLTSDAVAWLDRNISPADTVAEVGGGRSTPWWASRTEAVFTVETSPTWATMLLLHLYSKPNLLGKVRLWHVPADWHPSWQEGRSEYWRDYSSVLNRSTIDRLERDYLHTITRIPSTTVLVIDGSLRCHVMVLLDELDLLDRYEIIVVDNTESRFHSMYLDATKMSSFRRLDFVTGQLRQFEDEPERRHVTSIFVRNDRHTKTVAVPTERPVDWTATDLADHQDFFPDDDARAGVAAYADSLRKRLVELGLLSQPDNDPNDPSDPKE